MYKFIVLEGIDGSGKSTMCELIKERYKNIHITREPTDREVGKIAKKIAHENSNPYLDLFLYLADRAQHIEMIKSELNSKNNVICDRYWGSTAAYQAAYSEIEMDYIEEIQQSFILKPDATFLFDLDPKTSLERLAKRNKKSKYEKLDFLKKVRKNYLTLANKYDWNIIDAEKGLEAVKNNFLKELEKII